MYLLIFILSGLINKGYLLESNHKPRAKQSGSIIFSTREIPQWLKDMRAGKTTTFKPPVPFPPRKNTKSTTDMPPWLEQFISYQKNPHASDVLIDNDHQRPIWLQTLFDAMITIDDVEEIISTYPPDKRIINGKPVPQFVADYFLQRKSENYRVGNLGDNYMTTEPNKLTTSLKGSLSKSIANVLAEAMDTWMDENFPVLTNMKKEDVESQLATASPIKEDPSNSLNIVCQQSLIIYSGHITIDDFTLASISAKFKAQESFGDIILQDGLIELDTDRIGMECTSTATPDLRKTTITMSIPRLTLRYNFDLVARVSDHINTTILGSIDILLKDQQLDATMGVSKDINGTCKYKHISFRLKFNFDDQKYKASFTLYLDKFTTLSKMPNWDYILNTYITQTLLRRKEWTESSNFADFHDKLLMTATDKFSAQEKKDVCDMDK